MSRLLIHNPCNGYTRYYRYYNYFWDKFTDRLKETHTVIENRYFEKAHSERFLIELQDGSHTLLMECEYLIENLDTKNFYILSISDDLSHAILDLQNHPNLQKILISQFYRKKIEHHVTATNIHKYSPWIYFHSDYNIDLKYWREQRDSILDYNNNIVFRGTNLESRPILNHINKNIFIGPNSIGSSEIYFRDVIQYKVGLSVSGRGEFCYRDIEYMAIGIPILRFEYRSEMYHKLIPDYHYISIPYPEDMPLDNGLPTDRLGMRRHAQMIENKFLEVCNNIEYLKYISENAKNYYDNYLTLKNSIDLTLNILNL
jgi:hypothetical protein